MKFTQQFQALTGHPPFPWQRALYDRFAAGQIPEICSLPTGMGKTSIIAVWLIALAEHPDRVPRRLAYVVNRRTVVDQTTFEVEKYRKNLRAAGLESQLQNLCAIPREKEDSPLAISTLRGQFADNREWSIDPARPAVICGTVDMIGSRLLFSGYGCGFKAKPLHAGFLGQDTLLVHDEAHLEPAFQELIEEIRIEQASSERTGDLPWKKLQVMELTATPRGKGAPFTLTDSEKTPPDTIPSPLSRPVHHVWARLCSKKALGFHQSKRDQVAVEMAKHARDQWGRTEKSVLLFAQTISDVNAIRNELLRNRKDGPVEHREGVPTGKIQVLTGTMRGLERDKLADEDPVFARFMPNPKVKGTSGTVFLISTSAGEVGVDISADHMVCDLVTFDSMAQRFGRVNRRGSGDSMIDVFFETDRNPKPPSPEYEAARWKSKEILERLPKCESVDTLARFDASPLKLGELFEAKTDSEREFRAKERDSAFAPKPTILPATDMLFDAWALTTIREKLPGRPPVEPYLHGLSNWDPAQTKVAWREELEIIQGDLLEEYEPGDLLDIFPLKPSELLSDRTDRVFDQLKKMPNGVQNPDTPVWVIASDGMVTSTTIRDVTSGDKKALEGVTLLLPPSIGGLQGGMLTSSSDSVDDVSCELYVDKAKTQRLRFRFRSDVSNAVDAAKAEDVINEIANMRLVLCVDTQPDCDDDLGEEQTKVESDGLTMESISNHKKRYWFWFERVDCVDELGGRTSKQKITWDHHTSDVTANAQRIANKLLKNEPDLHSALITAARWHDLGKKRALWQRSIGRPTSDEGTWYAKSDPSWPSETVKTLYRHEFGSLVDILSHEIPESRGDLQALRDEFKNLSPHVQDLVLYLIATHHGHARPHFPADRAFDPEPKGYDTSQLASDIPRRFARLQRQYGRWGLAYLESLLRAADGAASAHPTDDNNSAEEAHS